MPKTLKLLTLVVVLTFSFEARAADTYTSEVCGDGIDNDNSGGAGWGASLLTHPAGDAACTGISDKDRDGYTTTDCDDTNRHIYPGAWTTSGCTGGQFRKCGTDGTYGSCTSTYTCEATNSKVCYYIDAVNGNDSNTGLSTAAAWKSFQPITSGCASGTCHTPAAGEVFVVRAGTYNTNVSASGCGNNRQILCVANNDGTTSYPITIRNYPGEVPLIASTNTSLTEGAQFLFYMTGNWIVEGLSFTGGYGDAIKLEDSDSAAPYIIRHNLIYAIRGASGNNVGGVSAGGVENGDFSNNIIYDVQGELGGQTASGIILFQGKGSRVHHNVIFNPDQAVRSQGVFYKHAEMAGDGSAEFDHNILWGFQNNTNTVALSSDQRATHMHHNLILDSDGGALHASCDNGGDSYLGGGWLIEYNTVVRSKVSFKQSGWLAVPNCKETGLVTWSNNVAVDDTATYAQDYPFFYFDTYGSDAAYTAWAAGEHSETDNNCFYSSGNAALTNAFCVMCGSPGTTGAFYNFNDYKTATGDAHIYNEDANLSSNTFTAQSTNCATKGWMGDAGAEPTPTPTPTATPTPTPPPPGANAIRGKRRR